MANGNEASAPSAQSQSDQIFPLNQHKLTSAEVAHVFSALLGRKPENQTVWTAEGALDALLSISMSDERRAVVVSDYLSKQEVGPLSITNSNSSSMLTYNADKVIGEIIRGRGSFEEDAITRVTDILSVLNVGFKKRFFVDVGANIGTHCLKALQSGFSNALCVEADPNNFRLLRANQILNDVDVRCTNILAAASDREGMIVLEVSPSNFGDNRVISYNNLKSGMYGEEKWINKEIPSKTLDSMLSSSDIEVDDVGMVWVDTQGHEGHVLSGAKTLIRTTIPIVVEFWPYGLDRSEGYKRLRTALEGRRRIYDLRDSTEGANMAVVTTDDLDNRYDNFLRGNTGSAYHTDLLLL